MPPPALLAASLAASVWRQASALRALRDSPHAPAASTEGQDWEALAVDEQRFDSAELIWSMPKDLLDPPTWSQREPRNMSKALECLRKTAPSLENLTYPADAERHAQEIRDALRPWSNDSFVGTCHAEDLWVAGFGHIWFDRANRSSPLSDYFGPYIPIFVRWIHPMMTNRPYSRRLHYPDGMLEALRKVLRKDVLYAVVSVNDEGWVGKNEFAMSEFPNVLVLSAGGYGHVPVPLVSGHGKTEQKAMKTFNAENAHLGRQRMNLADREYFLSYVGTVGHAPFHLREEMKSIVEKWASDRGIPEKVLFYRSSNRTEWEQVMHNSRYSLAPRGFGRTSYHLAETLHRGLIPIHVYSDVPWIPYQKLVDEVGFTTTLAELRPLLERLHQLSDEEVSRRERRALELADSHFTAYQVMRQMSRFLTGGETDLICQQLPRTIRDEDMPYPAIPNTSAVVEN